jgi:hypothetical protein
MGVMSDGAIDERMVITNPVPTPEEMAARLGISNERVSALRKIMGSPSPHFRVKRQAASVSLKRRGSRAAKEKELDAKASAR